MKWPWPSSCPPYWAPANSPKPWWLSRQMCIGGWVQKLIEILPDMLGKFYGLSPYPVNASIDGSSGKPMQMHARSRRRSEHFRSWDMQICVFHRQIPRSASVWGATGRPQAALRSHQLSGASPKKQLWWALVPAILSFCILIHSASHPCSLFGTLCYKPYPNEPVEPKFRHACAQPSRNTRMRWSQHFWKGGGWVPWSEQQGCMFTNGNSRCSGVGGSNGFQDATVDLSVNVM